MQGSLIGARNGLLRTALGLAFVVVFLAASSAHGADYKRGPNAFLFHVGGQGSWGGPAPAGVKLYFEFDRRLKRTMWLDLELNLVFGDRWGRRDCWWDPHDERWYCGDYWQGRGMGMELFAGVKWRFYPSKVPIVPFAKVGGQVVFLSYPDDLFGFAIAARGGGGFMFYPIKSFGFGLQANMALGFGFLNHHYGFGVYWAFDMGIGIEVLF